MTTPTPIETLRRQVRIAAARSFDTGVCNVALNIERRRRGVIHVEAEVNEYSSLTGELYCSHVLAAGWSRTERAALLEAMRSVMDNVRGSIAHDRAELRKERRELARLRGLVKKGCGR